MGVLKVGAGLFFGLALIGTLTANKGTAPRDAQAASTQASNSGCYVRKEGFNRLNTSMSYGQAASTLGCEGEEISRSDIAGYSTVMYQWQGSSMGANMNAMFQNGTLVSKAQFGLN